MYILEISVDKVTKVIGCFQGEIEECYRKKIMECSVRGNALRLFSVLAEES